MRFPSFAAIAVVALSAACTKTETKAPAPPPAPAGPDIQTREVTYQAGSTTLKGFVAWDAARTDRRPGVLVVHEWWGQNQHARNQAKRLAEAGYVGFALDMYGDGKSTTHPDSAQAFMMAAVKDLPAMQARFDAALAQLKMDPHVDSTKVAAIGYCFGGNVVLTEARAGAPLAAVVSFHGALPTSPAVDSGKVKARVLVLAGGADPMVPPDLVAKFTDQMKKAGANFDVVSYPGVKHSFTNPDADKSGVPGLAYNADADRESWAAAMKLFSEVFP